MSATKYNLKNPGVKRIMQEARELAKESTYEYDAHPLEDNIFEWHFTVRGPKDTDFEEGRYHGRIILPSEYPFKPPEIIFLTPNGRFELNTKICLSITGFHPEFWQPAWGIRTVLLAVIGFFPTEARGAIGGLDYTKEERQRLAKKSIGWVCSVCQINTKDALSDIPPDTPAGEKEVLPDFMISYKSADRQEDTAEGSDISSAVVVVEDVEDVKKKTGEETPAEDKNVTKDKTSEKETSAEECESAEVDNKIDSETIEEKNPYEQQTVSTNQQEDVQVEDVVREEIVENITAEQHRSPMWLDALIGGLVSVLIGLICRKYAM